METILILPTDHIKTSIQDVKQLSCLQDLLFIIRIKPPLIQLQGNTDPQSYPETTRRCSARGTVRTQVQAPSTLGYSG